MTYHQRQHDADLKAWPCSSLNSPTMIPPFALVINSKPHFWLYLVFYSKTPTISEGKGKKDRVDTANKLGTIPARISAHTPQSGLTAPSTHRAAYGKLLSHKVEQSNKLKVKWERYLPLISLPNSGSRQVLTMGHYKLGIQQFNLLKES